MPNNQKPPLVLTKSQRAFVETLLRKNEFVIKYTISRTLGQVYGYLADECVGEMCLLMCEKVSVLEAHGNPQAWLIASAKLTAFTVMKKNRNDVKGVPLEQADAIVPDTIFEEVLHSIWLQNDTQQKLLDRLTKREKQVYYKLYVENKSIQTIAEELGVTPSTVRTMKQTLKDKILEQINKKI